MDFNVANRRFDGARGAAVGYFDQTQHRLNGMPLLAEGGLSAFDAVAREFPMGLEPVRIAHHDDKSVFDDLLQTAAVFARGELMR